MKPSNISTGTVHTQIANYNKSNCENISVKTRIQFYYRFLISPCVEDIVHNYVTFAGAISLCCVIYPSPCSRLHRAMNLVSSRVAILFIVLYHGLDEPLVKL